MNLSCTDEDTKFSRDISSNRLLGSASTLRIGLSGLYPIRILKSESYRQSVGHPGWVICPSQGRYLHRTTQIQNKSGQTSTPRVGFESTIQMFEREKTFHVLLRGHCYQQATRFIPEKAPPLNKGHN
jgi:hypothetical protein